MSASRLPGKPLLKINGISIIQHVYNKAKATNLGKVYVATEDAEIQNEIEKNGGNSIMTSKSHQTGTDRIFEAIEKIKDVENTKYVINLQGDEPQISTKDIINLDKNVRKLNSKIGTLGTDIKDKKIFSNKNIVKVTVNETFRKNNHSPALNFFGQPMLNLKENFTEAAIKLFKTLFESPIQQIFNLEIGFFVISSTVKTSEST